jgi:hypothetical protein
MTRVTDADGLGAVADTVNTAAAEFETEDGGQ